MAAGNADIEIDIFADARQAVAQLDSLAKTMRSEVVNGAHAADAALDRMGSTTKKQVGIIDSFKGSWLGVTAAFAAVSGAVAGVHAILGAADDLVDASNKIGALPDELYRIQAAAEVLGGTNLGTVTDALIRLQRGAEEGGDVGKIFERLGISMQDFFSMGPQEQLLTLADAYATAKKDGTLFADFNDLLGRGFKEILPLLAGGREGMEKFFAGVKTPANDTLRDLADLNDSIDTLIVNIKSLATMSLGPVARQINDMAAAFKFMWSHDKGATFVPPSIQQKIDRSKADAAAEETRKNGATATTNKFNDAKDKADKDAQKKIDDEQEKKDKALKDENDKAKDAKKVFDATTEDLNSKDVSGLPQEDQIKYFGNQLGEAMDKAAKEFGENTVEGLIGAADEMRKMGDFAGMKDALDMAKEIKADREKLHKAVTGKEDKKEAPDFFGIGDSLTSIGGGGNFFSGAGSLDEERNRLLDNSNKILEEIKTNTANRGGSSNISITGGAL